jgi:glycosyltransferase involved in cell wall biosynthesis
VAEARDAGVADRIAGTDDAGASHDGAGASTARVAIAHDWLVRYAGSERCVEELLRAFPGSRVLTTLVRPDHVPAAMGSAEPSFLQRIPGAVDHHEVLLPLMPLAWRARPPIDGVDAVVSSSHACAKAVRVAPGIPHVSYCHTPMRYAWDFEMERERFPKGSRAAARQAMRAFRRWDRRSSDRVTRFVANSSAVAGRIGSFYGRRAEVVPPPVRTDWFTPGDGDRDDVFLYVGRLVGYKRVDLVVEAFRDLPHRLVVVGDGQLLPRLRAEAPPNVRIAGAVPDEELRELYRTSRAMVYPADEDFGIVMAEAQACGLPVIGLRRGGALDIVRDGETGWLIDDQTVGAVRGAVALAARGELDEDEIRRSAERFSTGSYRRRMQEIVETTIADPRPV